MAQRKKKPKRLKTKHQRSQQPPLFQKRRLPDDVVVVPSPPGASMSEVILDFIEPYADEWRTPIELKGILNVAMIAWNAALVSGDKRQKLKDTLLNAPPEMRLFLMARLEEMIKRKLTHFAGNTRAIIDCEVRMTPDGPHVSVMSTLPADGEFSDTL